MSFSKKNFVSYVNNNAKYTKYIPQHLQRLQIESFSKKRKIKVIADFLEYNNMNHLPVLFSLISEKKQKNIIIFSVNSIGINKKIVKKFMTQISKYRKNILFANEGLSNKNNKELKIIKKITSHKSFLK